MNGNVERTILGEYADQGYWLREYEDHVITVGYKEKELAAFSQIAPETTLEVLRDVCRRHQTRLKEPVGMTR